MATGERAIPPGALAGPGIMLLSAAIFGYFGFTTLFPNLTTTNPPQLIPMVVALEWTLKTSAVAFLACALLTFIAALPGNILYAIIGLLAASMFLIIAVWDINSTYYTGVHWFILLLFAAWNGFGSWTGLRNAMLVRRITAAPRENPWQADVPPPSDRI